MGNTSGMPPMGNQGMPPMGNTSGMPPMGNHSGMPPMGDTTGMPPMGNDSGMPMGMSNLGDHCGEIQAKNEKKRMRKEVKCLRQALNDHKPTAKVHDRPKDGLGAYHCGVKRTGSKPAQIACLRDLLDGPTGKPGMAPMGISGEITYCEEFSDQPKKRGEVNCLRDLLDQTPLSETVRHAKKGKKRGFYKCGSKDRAQHVGCLRDLLKGQNDKPGMAPGTN
jgi:hypothetical protein